MRPTDQPSIDALNVQWTRAIEVEDMPGIHSDACLELRKLRDARTTWLGESENALRRALDGYLAHYHA